jgi:hypothetical protein
VAGTCECGNEVSYCELTGDRSNMYIRMTVLFIKFFNNILHTFLSFCVWLLVSV